MRIAVSADELAGVAPLVAGELRRRGHEAILHGVLAEDERSDWAWASERAALDVAEGRAEQAVVCCWTGTGASIAANKVAGIRAALCADVATAAGARRWNDANVLALSLRSTSEAGLGEILDAWFAGAPSAEPDDVENVTHVGKIAVGLSAVIAPELAVRRGREAVEFYKRALGATELYRVGGTDEHEPLVSQLSVGGATFWVHDEAPEQGNHSPESLGGASARILLVVEDPAGVQAKALAEGAREHAPVSSEHGWMLGRIEDPFGHHWEIGRPLGGWPPQRS
ncbi:MAG TPA: RpiB/LacA/LacB family sugar-phosphate isomerase [Solirubrobacteraceae bacterium]